jgi:energy-converting hydrogenase Eha subunit E
MWNSCRARGKGAQKVQTLAGHIPRCCKSCNISDKRTLQIAGNGSTCISLRWNSFSHIIFILFRTYQSVQRTYQHPVRISRFPDISTPCTYFSFSWHINTLYVFLVFMTYQHPVHISRFHDLSTPCTYFSFSWPINTLDVFLVFLTYQHLVRISRFHDLSTTCTYFSFSFASFLKLSVVKSHLQFVFQKGSSLLRICSAQRKQKERLAVSTTRLTAEYY